MIKTMKIICYLDQCNYMNGICLLLWRRKIKINKTNALKSHTLENYTYASNSSSRHNFNGSD